MEAMFHAWMKWLTLDRTYPSEEENAKRLEIFKETLKRVESVYAGAGKSSPSPHLPNLFADRTEEEWRAMTRRKINAKPRRTRGYVYRMMEVACLSSLIAFCY